MRSTPAGKGPVIAAVVGRQGRGGSRDSRLEAGEGASLAPAEGKKGRSPALVRERGKRRRSILPWREIEEESGEWGGRRD
jgi:hypothetical protein